jgi:geranylgeranyl diphosphate synthase type II
MTFQEFLRQVAVDVDERLGKILPPADAPPARLHGAMRYSIFAGGKRVRPGLVVLAGETFGASREKLLSGAAAMEMIHTFSLIHDDLPALDNDDLRRGRPTLHCQYNEALAILAGDGLFSLALLCLSREPAAVSAQIRAQAVEIASSAVDEMIAGQVLDIEAENDWPQDPAAAILELHRLKTGALLTASLRLGGVYGGASKDEDDLLRRLGDRLGLLFQIGDDILDVEGDTDVLGKTAGKDAEARKLTYPGLFGLEESRRRLDVVLKETLELAEGMVAYRELFVSLVRFLSERDR